MASRYDVFLSHSTTDKPAVEELARQLRNAGIEPFLDKWHLVPGRLWQSELEKGLEDSRACAIFLGSEGFGPWHRQEMLVALDRGARDSEYAVIPVLLPGFNKPAEIPAFLAQRTWVEFPTLADKWAFHCLLSAIRGEIPGPGPGSAPSKSFIHYRSMAQPPEGFIHRREYYEVLKALCPADGGVRSTSVGITTALRGAGGFGKTDLAQAICQDPRVRETYPDGILWTTMKEDIDANGRLARVRDLIRWWTEEKENPTFENLSAASSRLRALLAGHRVLIVVDDVWSSADVTPFQGIGPEAALLITTRDSQTLPLDAARIVVDAMAELEAVSLLRAGLPDGNQEAFRALAERLGEWPLLLKIVNRHIRELVQEDLLSPEEALREVEETLEAQGLTAFDREDQNERNRAVSLTINASLTRLSEEERDRYGQLAIFPEDADVPLSVLACLWGLGRFETKALCSRLYSLSLLLGFNRRSGTVRLHDVIRQFLILQRQSELPALHGRLLDACPCWQDLPREEGYLWRHLASHLLGAERREELRELLLDFSYLQAKLEATDINALISDHEPFVGERELRLIRDALRLSAHVLAWDCAQLASQLLGRLLGFEGRCIHRLLQGATSWREAMWLQPRVASLTPPGGPLIRTLEGHTDRVAAVTVIDNRRVISGSADGTLRVWDLESGRSLRNLRNLVGHKASIRAVAVVDGRRAVSASDDGTLQVWDLENGDLLRSLEGHSGRVCAVAAVDERRVVSASDDWTLRVWDLESGATVRSLRGHLDWVRAVAVIDHRRVVSGSYDGTLRIWDLESGKTLRSLEGHSDWVQAVAVEKEFWAISGTANGTLQLWDLETGDMMRSLKGCSGGLNSVALLDGQRVVSVSDGGILEVWNLESGISSLLHGHLGGLNAVAVMDGSRVVTAGDDRTLRVWDLEIQETLRPAAVHSGGIKSIALIDHRRAVLASDETLRVWDLEADESLYSLAGHSGEVGAVAVIDSGRAVSGSYDWTVRVWDLETGETLQCLTGHSGWVLAVAGMDGQRVVSASGDQTLRVWDLETGETLQLLEHSGDITAIAVVDSSRLIYASDDGLLRQWGLDTSESLCLRGHLDRINAVVVVDGRWAVSASNDRTLRVWDLEAGTSVRTLEGHIGEVYTVAVVDRRRAVSGSSDQTLRVWNLETGAMLAVFTLDAPVSAVAVARDGRMVVAGDRSGVVHLFDLVEPE